MAIGLKRHEILLLTSRLAISKLSSDPGPSLLLTAAAAEAAACLPDLTAAAVEKLKTSSPGWDKGMC